MLSNSDTPTATLATASVSLLQSMKPVQEESASRQFKAVAFTGQTFGKDKSIQENLAKWGLASNMRVSQFQFFFPWSPYQVDLFLSDLFNHPDVLQNFKVLNSSGYWASLGTRVEKIEYEPINASVLSMDFFDKLENCREIIRKNGDIVKCFDEYTEDNIVVSDELRKFLLMPESDQFELYSTQDRSEFIFHLFKALCLGGQLCQFEDEVETYFKTCKLIYKDLISVVKDGATQELKIISNIYRIRNAHTTLTPLFPCDHPLNFCYVIVDPQKHCARLLYHAETAYY